MIREMFIAGKKKGIEGKDHETDLDCDKLVELQVFSEPGKVYKEAITIIRLTDMVMRTDKPVGTQTLPWIRANRFYTVLVCLLFSATP